MTAHRLRRLRVQALALLLLVVVRNGVIVTAVAAVALAVFILAPFALLAKWVDVERSPLLTCVLCVAWFWILGYLLRPRLGEFDRLWKRWAADVTELRDAVSAAGIDIHAVREELRRRQGR